MTWRILVGGLLVLACAPRLRAQARAQLELSLDDNHQILTVTLRNTTAVPLRIDRELRFALSIEPLDAEGKAVDLEQVGELRHDSGPLPDESFVELRKGQAVTRTVNLRDGFWCFVYGHSTERETHVHRSFGYEKQMRLKQTSRPTRVQVAYDIDMFDFPNAFRQYTGRDLTNVRLFTGPVRQTVVLPTTGPTTSTTRP